MFTGPALTGSELLTDHMVTESAELTEVMANEMYLPRWLAARERFPVDLGTTTQPSGWTVVATKICESQTHQS
jgi:hypothetical protein